MTLNKVLNLRKILGPIILSALSILISFFVIQPIACYFDPSFNLLANRGIGKIAFMTIVILHIFLLLALGSKDLFKNFLQTNFYFFKNENWVKPFFKFFAIFAFLHIITLASFTSLGFANIVACDWKWTVGFRILFGFVATFFLAWSEELIFRGTLYQYLVQGLKPISAALLASLIFMLAHGLTTPLNLITVSWRPGLGLSLLGFLLNIIFILTGKLYTGMGAHAGLVFIKVFLRRLPFIQFLPIMTLPIWVHQDLRQSLLVHVGFSMLIIFLIIKNKQKLFS